MSTDHRWFRSGAYSLLAHIDCPTEGAKPYGVLMVPPFGWEDVCAYRPLRLLARMFAANGVPTLRFDLPGTGDSSGGARDARLFDGWIDAIGDAAAELRRAAQVDRVVTLGVHMGAMLALEAVRRGANLRDLILWGPAGTGKAILREMHAFSKLASAEYATAVPLSSTSNAGFEAGGFLISEETESALKNLDLSKAVFPCEGRALLLTRDELPVDTVVVTALESANWQVTVQASSEYGRMLAIPEDSVLPENTGHSVLAYLAEPDGRAPNFMPDAETRPEAQAADVSGAIESVYQTDCPSGSLFGILSEPVSPSPHDGWCILFLNPGAVRHTGPNRMWVEASRRWAAQGVASLRADLEGIGESDGEPNLDVPGMYQDRFARQVLSITDDLRARAGFRHFVLVGLCAGAFWAFHAAFRSADVRAAVLINPRLFFWDPEVDRRRILQRTARMLTERTDWIRFARGYISFESLKRVMRILFEASRKPGAEMRPHPQISPGAMAQAWDALRRNQNRLTLIFTEGEPLLREMEEEGHLPPPADLNLRCIRVANCGHTFRPLWAQQMAHELIDRELSDAIRLSTSRAAPRTEALPAVAVRS